MSIRRSSRSLAWCLAAATLLSLPIGDRLAHVAAGSPVDVRGTWEVSVKFTNYDLPDSSFRFVAHDQSASGSVTGLSTGVARGDPFETVLTGTISGDQFTFEFRVTGSKETSNFTATLKQTARGPTMRGSWTNTTSDVVGTFRARVVKSAAARSAEGGGRSSATLVICNRDMTSGTDPAVLRCNALVADASGLPGSRTPTGSVTWESGAGSLGSESCTLSGGGAGGVSSCVVSLTGSATDLPIGAELPVTASYAGDVLYAPSEASHRLFGQAAGFTESDQYGPDCTPAAPRYPSTTCGDPVNPATGNLSMTVADVGISGRGFALAVVRTYNAQAAAGGESGRFGIGWSDEHEARLVRDGKRVTVHLGTGATVRFRVKGKRFEAPGWATATLTQAKGKGYVLTFADQTRLTFDGQGRLTSFSDRRDAPITLSRNKAGAILAASDTAGRSLTFERDEAGRVTSVTDPQGRVVGYAYDDQGRLTMVTDVAGGITRYAYDERHRMTSITDPRGSTATTAYDADDRVVRQTDPLGGVIAFEYAGTYPDLITAITDGKGVQAAFEYRKGMPFAETQALGTGSAATTTHLYDADMRHIGTVDPNGGPWLISRDAAGNILTTRDPLGRTTRIGWNERNQITSVFSPLGIWTIAEYDERGMVTKVRYAAATPDEAATTVAYEDPEHPMDVTSITDSLGAVTRFEYDAAGNVVRATDALGGVTRWDGNALGWVMAVTDPLGHQTSISRDARGLATAITEPMGDVTSATWDPAGALTSVTDAMGSLTSLVHDAAGRTSGARLADGATPDVVRDSLGDVLSQSDASGAATTRAHDALRRVVSVADPLGNETSATYDLAGNVISTTNALGNTTRFEWDAANQLLGIDYADDTPDVAFTYDRNGRRTAMTDGTGTTTYEYDERDRLVRVTDGGGGTVGVTWDVRGALTSVTYPDGLIVSYGYDALGRMVSVGDSVGDPSTFTYDAAGRLLTSTLGDGSVTSRTYDDRGALLSISGGPVDIAYGRDALGRVASITDAGRTPTRTTHDARGRLIGLGDETFGVDPAGALTSLRDASLTHDEGGRLVEMIGDEGTTRFTFDDVGRRVAQAGASSVAYGYDAVGRLTSVGSSTWAYDGDGLRRSATHPGGTTAQFSWLTVGGRPLLLADGTSRFVYGPGGMPLAQVDASGTTEWVHTDQAGSVRALTGDDGAILGTFSFDAYGLPTERTGSADTRLGFHGNYTEVDTGLQYLLARVYDPGTGRFLTVDPLVLRTLQPYAFAAGDPLTYGDPTGLDVALAGHGAWRVGNGLTTVPDGTTVIFHTPAGWGMMDDYGKLVEGGGAGRFEERFGPGSVIPNYLLSPPDRLAVLKTSRTVSSPTLLRDLLSPNQGNVHWAACRNTMESDGYRFVVGKEALDQWVREHWYNRADASDYEPFKGWGMDSAEIFGDARNKKLGDFGGAYWIAEPVILMPGV